MLVATVVKPLRSGAVGTIMPVITVHLQPKHTFNPRGIKGGSPDNKDGVVAHDFFVDSFDQVINLKIYIFKAWGVPVEDQKLVFTCGDRQQIMYARVGA